MINSHVPKQLDEFIKHIKEVFPGSRVLSAEEAEPFKGIYASYKSKLAKEKKPSKRHACVIQENLSLFDSMDHLSEAVRQRDRKRENVRARGIENLFGRLK